MKASLIFLMVASVLGIFVLFGYIEWAAHAKY